MKRVNKLVAWLISPEGRKDAGALVALITAVYTGLHRAGVL